MDLLTNSGESHIDVCVGKPNNMQTQRFQIGRSCFVISNALGIVVLRTVNFDHELCRVTVEIYDVFSYNSLLIDL